jgi:hypothetical protein
MASSSSKVIHSRVVSATIHQTIASFRSMRRSLAKEVSIGFIPTMGALHDGENPRRESEIRSVVPSTGLTNNFSILLPFSSMVGGFLCGAALPEIMPNHHQATCHWSKPRVARTMWSSPPSLSIRPNSRRMKIWTSTHGNSKRTWSSCRAWVW